MGGGLTIGLTIELTIGLTIGLTIILAIGPTIGLTTDSQQTHNALTMDSQWTHKGHTKDSHRIHNEIIEKALVFLGCPRKMLFLQWFYKIVRENGCFYIGFVRLSASNAVFTLVLRRLSAKMLVKPA